MHFFIFLLIKSLLGDELKTMNFESFSIFLVDILSSCLAFSEIIKIVQDAITMAVHEAQSQGVIVGINITDEDPIRQEKSHFDDDDDELGSSLMLSARLEKLDILEKKSPVEQSSSTFGHYLVETSNLVYSVADPLHNKLAKLLSMRTEQTCQFSPRSFYWYYGSVLTFVKISEELSERAFHSIKSSITTQVFYKQFV